MYEVLMKYATALDRPPEATYVLSKPPHRTRQGSQELSEEHKKENIIIKTMKTQLEILLAMYACARACSVGTCNISTQRSANRITQSIPIHLIPNTHLVGTLPMFSVPLEHCWPRRLDVPHCTRSRRGIMRRLDWRAVIRHIAIAKQTCSKHLIGLEHAACLVDQH